MRLSRLLSPPPSPGVTSQLCHPIPQCVALANQRLRPQGHRGSSFIGIFVKIYTLVGRVLTALSIFSPGRLLLLTKQLKFCEMHMCFSNATRQ